MARLHVLSGLPASVRAAHLAAALSEPHFVRESAALLARSARIASLTDLSEPQHTVEFWMVSVGHWCRGVQATASLQLSRMHPVACPGVVIYLQVPLTLQLNDNLYVMSRVQQLKLSGKYSLQHTLHIATTTEDSSLRTTVSAQCSSSHQHRHSHNS
jgi:hypothetical protein